MHIDKELVKEALKELIMENPSIVKIISEQNNSMLASDNILSEAEKRKVKLIDIINKDFIKYENVFKALA